MQLSDPQTSQSQSNGTQYDSQTARTLASSTLIDDSMNHPPSPPLPPSSEEGFAPVLRNSRFMILWMGQIFSQLADKVYLVLMIALIAGHFQAADQPISGWVSAIMMTFTIPAFLFGSLAGVFVDRWSKKGVLIISNLIRGALVLTIPPLLWLLDERTLAIPLHGLPTAWRQWQAQPQDTFDVPLGFVMLLAQTFIISTITQFFAPAEQATIPLIVKRRHLLPANSLFTTTMMGTLIIGFAIGEPLLEIAAQLISVLKLPWEVGQVAVVGGSYLIAGLILLFLKTKEQKLQRLKERPHVFEDIWDGVRYLSKNRRVRNALIQLIILFCVLAALSVLAVRLAELIPQMKAEQFGFLLATTGVGMALGATFIGNLGQRFSPLQLSLWGSLGMGVCLGVLSLFPTQLGVALVTTIVIGAFAALIGVPMQTTIQSETPSDMRGKVFGLQNNAVNIALSLPLAVAGIAETKFGLRPVLLSLAVLMMATGLVTWYVSFSVRSTKVDQ